MSTTTTTPEAFIHLQLWIDPITNLLICTQSECKYAISIGKSCVISHLRDKHKIPTHARKGLFRLLKTLPLSKPDDVSPAEDGSLEHPKLQVYDGFACCECKFRTIHFPTMRRHFSDPLATDCPSNTAAVRYGNIDHLFEYVYLQTWVAGSKREYWIIKRNGSVAWLVRDERTDLHMWSVHEREEVRHAGAGSEQQEVSAPQITNLTYTEQSCCIKRTGWDTTYRDKSRQALIAITQMPYEYPSNSNSNRGHVVCGRGQDGCEEDLVSPPDDEERIARIASQVDALMDRCEETAEKTSRNLRCWLRSTRPRSAYTKPFELVQLPSTKKSYRRLWKRVLVLVLRAYRLDPDTRDRLTGIRLKKRVYGCIQLI
ncbi:hypothetical protein EDB80DRAFT_744228 [Ilyonectria destructans]|nr:hypothetical protein EDB80DRAFT_744228 [Ilyonectria destructans]